jgi:hypothetical protein
VGVPSEAGKAKITLSFPDWREGKVAPATFEVPIVDAKKADPSGEKTLLCQSIHQLLEFPDSTRIVRQSLDLQDQSHGVCIPDLAGSLKDVLPLLNSLFLPQSPFNVIDKMGIHFNPLLF